MLDTVLAYLLRAIMTDKIGTRAWTAILGINRTGNHKKQILVSFLETLFFVRECDVLFLKETLENNFRKKNLERNINGYFGAFVIWNPLPDPFCKLERDAATIVYIVYALTDTL